MTTLIHAVMCGGSGTRLWPWSRRSYPKQFLTLLDDKSLLQTTVDRLEVLPERVETLVIGNEEHRFLIAEQLRATELGAAEIVLEPALRNTAGVALIAALRAAARHGEDSLVLLAPADHLITDAQAYGRAIETAKPAAEAGYLVTFGITPDRPETGYGYIETGSEIAGMPGVLSASSFREKPDRETAEGFLSRGNFAWNAGIFLFSPKALIAAAEELHPGMLEACRRSSDEAKEDLDFLRLDAEAYAGIENISFDYAFAERMEKVAVVPVSMGWSDVGSWRALYEARGGNGNGENVVEGPAEIFDSQGVLAFSDGPLVVAQGVKDLVIVANHDAIYVADAAQTENVKAVVADLEKRNRREAVTHQRCYRPWGWYQTINMGERFHVKEIVVKPGGQLSLQAHHHRAEHWIVVKGTAQVTVDDEVKIVTENESVYIPISSRHRLENPGRIPMHLIEVQTGSYLEEDDIIRFEDVYGRS